MERRILSWFLSRLIKHFHFELGISSLTNHLNSLEHVIWASRRTSEFNWDKEHVINCLCPPGRQKMCDTSKSFSRLLQRWTRGRFSHLNTKLPTAPPPVASIYRVSNRLDDHHKLETKKSSTELLSQWYAKFAIPIPPSLPRSMPAQIPFLRSPHISPFFFIFQMRAVLSHHVTYLLVRWQVASVPHAWPRLRNWGKMAGDSEELKILTPEREGCPLREFPVKRRCRRKWRTGWRGPNCKVYK